MAGPRLWFHRAKLARGRSSGADGAPLGAQSLARPLRRTLSVIGNVAVTLSGITPCASVFIIAPVVLVAEGTGTFWSFVVAAIIGVCMALVWGELGSMYPFAGGQFELITRVFGRALGFLAFACMLTLVVFVPSSIALGAGQYLSVLIPHANAHVVGAIIMIGAAGIAILSVKTNSWVTGAMLAIELTALTIVAVLGFSHIHQPVSYLIHPRIVTGGHIAPATLGVVATGVSTAIFAYNGYDGSIQLSEETKGRSNAMAVAILWALAITVVAELVPVVAAMLGAPSLPALVASSSPMQYVVTALGGATLNKIVSLGVFIAICNATVAIVLLYGRTVFGSAREKAWPEPLSSWLATVHPRFRSPWVATALVGAGGAILTYVSSIAALITFTGVVLVVLYALSALAALASRITQKGASRPFRMPWWPLPPLVALAALGYVFAQQTAHDIIIMACILVGAGVYYLAYLRQRPDARWVIVGHEPEEAPGGDPARGRSIDR